MSFLDEIKNFSQFLKGYQLVKKYKFDKKQWTQGLAIPKICPTIGNYPS